MNIKRNWVWMFWTFNLSFDILATVLATVPNIGQIFAQFSGHSAQDLLARIRLGLKGLPWVNTLAYWKFW
jgi:hypothetical protein